MMYQKQQLLNNINMKREDQPVCYSQVETSCLYVKEYQREKTEEEERKKNWS
jgi:hypothetical protein